MTRVSPPELARALPGPHASPSVPSAPARRRFSAVHPPKAPAPTTATRSGEAPRRCRGITADAGRTIEDFKNSRRDHMPLGAWGQVLDEQYFVSAFVVDELVDDLTCDQHS